MFQSSQHCNYEYVNLFLKAICRTVILKQIAVKNREESRTFSDSENSPNSIFLEYWWTFQNFRCFFSSRVCPPQSAAARSSQSKTSGEPAIAAIIFSIAAVLKSAALLLRAPSRLTDSDRVAASVVVSAKRLPRQDVVMVLQCFSSSNNGAHGIGFGCQCGLSGGSIPIFCTRHGRLWSPFNSTKRYVLRFFGGLPALPKLNSLCFVV